MGQPHHLQAHPHGSHGYHSNSNGSSSQTNFGHGPGFENSTVYHTPAKQGDLANRQPSQFHSAQQPSSHSGPHGPDSGHKQGQYSASQQLDDSSSPSKASSHNREGINPRMQQQPLQNAQPQHNDQQYNQHHADAYSRQPQLVPAQDPAYNGQQSPYPGPPQATAPGQRQVGPYEQYQVPRGASQAVNHSISQYYNTGHSTSFHDLRGSFYLPSHPGAPGHDYMTAMPSINQTTTQGQHFLMSHGGGGPQPFNDPRYAPQVDPNAPLNRQQAWQVIFTGGGGQTLAGDNNHYVQRMAMAHAQPYNQQQVNYPGHGNAHQMPDIEVDPTLNDMGFTSPQLDQSAMLSERPSMYLEAENSQLSINLTTRQPRMLQAPATPTQGGGGADCNLLTSRTVNQPVSDLFQNGRPVNGSGPELLQQHYGSPKKKQSKNARRQSALKIDPLNMSALSQQDNNKQLYRSMVETRSGYHQQPHAGATGAQGMTPGVQVSQYEHQHQNAHNQNNSQYAGGDHDQLRSQNNHQNRGAKSQPPPRYPGPQQREAFGHQPQAPQPLPHPTQYDAQSPLLTAATTKKPKGQVQQTTMAVDMSPMTVSHKIYVPHQNQIRVGSVIEPKSVHKLKYGFEKAMWNQRFMGGPGPVHYPHHSHQMHHPQSQAYAQNAAVSHPQSHLQGAGQHHDPSGYGGGHPQVMGMPPHHSHHHPSAWQPYPAPTYEQTYEGQMQSAYTQPNQIPGGYMHSEYSMVPAGYHHPYQDYQSQTQTQAQGQNQAHGSQGHSSSQYSQSLAASQRLAPVSEQHYQQVAAANNAAPSSADYERHSGNFGRQSTNPQQLLAELNQWNYDMASSNCASAKIVLQNAQLKQPTASYIHQMDENSRYLGDGVSQASILNNSNLAGGMQGSILDANGRPALRRTHTSIPQGNNNLASAQSLYPSQRAGGEHDHALQGKTFDVASKGGGKPLSDWGNDNLAQLPNHAHQQSLSQSNSASALDRSQYERESVGAASSSLMPSVIGGGGGPATTSMHDSYFTDNSRIIVRPNDPEQVQKVRKNFLEIARIEREDSRERDRNFMPQVDRKKAFVHTPKRDQDLFPRQRRYSMEPSRMFKQQTTINTSISQLLPPSPSQCTSQLNAPPTRNLTGSNLGSQNQHQMAPPALNLDNRASSQSHASRSGDQRAQKSSKELGNSLNMMTAYQPPLSDNQQHMMTAEQRNRKKGGEQNIYNSPQNSSISNVHNTSIGGRSLLAQQMENNGLNFDNSSSRLQRKVGSRGDRSMHRGSRGDQSELSKTPKLSKNSEKLQPHFMAVSPDKNSLYKAPESNPHKVSSNVSQARGHQRPQSQRPVGRPVGCKTMNDREFQKYQRSLFQQSTFLEEPDHVTSGAIRKINNNLRYLNQQPSAGAGEENNHSPSQQQLADHTVDTGPSKQKPFFGENQSEFNEISNISNIKGETVSQFMESGEADKFLGDENAFLPSKGHANDPSASVAGHGP